MTKLFTVIVVSLLFSLGAFAAAQEATPGDDFITPDPAECQIEPRTLESITSLAGTPAPVSPATPSFEDGVPADDEVVAAVNAIARESVACSNAGSYLAQFAFYTDEALLGIMPPGLTAEDIAAFIGGESEPLPEEGRFSVMVWDVMVLPDGRVTAYFVTFFPEEGAFTTFITFEKRGDGYVITSDINVEAEVATPAS